MRKQKLLSIEMLFLCWPLCCVSPILWPQYSVHITVYKIPKNFFFTNDTANAKTRCCRDSVVYIYIRIYTLTNAVLTIPLLQKTWHERDRETRPFAYNSFHWLTNWFSCSGARVLCCFSNISLRLSIPTAYACRVTPGSVCRWRPTVDAALDSPLRRYLARAYCTQRIRPVGCFHPACRFLGRHTHVIHCRSERAVRAMRHCVSCFYFWFNSKYVS